MAKPKQEPARSVHSWTDQQKAIFDWFANRNVTGDRSDHLIVDARAGSSKTTTLIEGALRAPEPSTLICAFNKKIAAEIENRMPILRPSGRVIHSNTLHSIGYSIVRHYWPGVKLNARRNEVAVRKVLGEKAPYKLIKAICETVEKVKECCPLAETTNDVIIVADDFDTFLRDDSKWDAAKQADLVLKTLDVLKQRDGELAYSDMIWLPVVQAWTPPSRYKLVIVDEAQDLSPAQLALAAKLGVGRSVYVGDRYQCIYGWRGADQFSLARLEKELDADRLPLTVSFRCARAIIRSAQQLVSDIQPASWAEEGEVSWIYENSIKDNLSKGDFILARLNAPLASMCLQLRRQGVPARIEGAETLQAVRKVFERLQAQGSATSTMSFHDRAQIWMAKEIKGAKAVKSPMREERAVDIGTMLMWLAKHAHTVDEIKATIDGLFKNKSPDDVVCMTVHKAKGLEADRVFLLRESFPQYRVRASKKDDYLPATTEERNIEYVAVTRAKKRLFWVSKVGDD